mgnify:CR=1 FL=1
MTALDRIDRVVRLGFTDRQARFLVTVMSHGGICLPRQYTAFAGIVYGQKTRKFFHRLVNEGYPSTCRCFHNRATIYQLQGCALCGADQGGCGRRAEPRSRQDCRVVPKAPALPRHRTDRHRRGRLPGGPLRRHGAVRGLVPVAASTPSAAVRNAPGLACPAGVFT